ncbi:MAG: hypothetical protein ACQETE_13140 [Bacteroidota bacterium]
MWLLQACEQSLPSHSVVQEPLSIEQLTISPDSLVFTKLPASASTDTTVIFDVVMQFSSSSSNKMEAQIDLVSELRDSILSTSSLSISEIASGQYRATGSFELTTSTTLSDRYTLTGSVQAEQSSPTWSEFAIPQLAQTGEPPEILSYDIPSPVTIPESGSKTIPFTAKVTDPDGQVSLQAVYLDLLNTQGQLIGDSPYQMKDNGGDESGDAVAGDSVYTVTFSINSQNQPAEYQARIYAEDNVGLRSDTVKTPFVLER